MSEEPNKPVENDPSYVETFEYQPASFKSFIFRHRRFLYFSLLIVAVAIVVTVTLVVERPSNFQDYIETSGYAGVFLMAIIGSTSPVWPLPGSWAAFIAGGVGLNPFLLGIAAGFGEPIGESTAYMTGYGGQVAITNIKGYRTVERWMKRRGGIILFLVSAIPNFIIKAAVVCAGALRYPFWKFFIFVWMGKTIKSMFFSFTGYYLFDTLFDLFDRFFGG